ncbi:DUF2726 domain-containing protein [Fulvimarina endophytica]|uniref:DUF2726 domain-containing protein n=2 Tax=Fulvimarina endophytica TaxID=2293836 RepID=A0A371WXV6_9HYPH|nr:DUF2726 domain-containing protein [Fulvimarina endophytica]
MDQSLAAYWPYAAGLFVLWVVLAVLKEWSRGSERNALLERKTLMTQPEKNFYRQLRAAFPDADIAPQVAMGALLKPRKGLNRKAWAYSRSQVAQKIVDFAIIDLVSGNVEVLVELDDKSHDAKHDAARDRLLAQGQYRVVRFRENARIEPDAIRERIGPLSGR